MLEYYHIDLSGYFNHKMIGVAGGAPSGAGIGNCELLDPALLPSNETVETNGISFVFPDTTAFKLDNIVCEQQLIPVRQGRYNALYCLGCSEWWDFKEKFTLVFHGGTEEMAEIFIQDFWVGHSHWEFSIMDPNCRVAFCPKNGDQITRFLYCSHALFQNSTAALQGIWLPFNPNIHILAMTLAINNN